jgi:hypothetical protein
MAPRADGGSCRYAQWTCITTYGHPGVAESHYQVVIWYVSPQQAAPGGEHVSIAGGIGVTPFRAILSRSRPPRAADQRDAVVREPHAGLRVQGRDGRAGRSASSPGGPLLGVPGARHRDVDPPRGGRPRKTHLLGTGTFRRGVGSHALGVRRARRPCETRLFPGHDWP